jgi:5'-nucleotidase
MLHSRARRVARMVTVLVALAMALGAGPAVAADETVEVQLLGFNDFHGALQPPSGSGGRIGTIEAGGAEYLATHVRSLSRANRNTRVVSAGDLIGASPLLSALFHDEPTIEAMNEIGLDYNAVGNHEFDEGEDELRRMQEGGCHPVDGCADGTGFSGARFQFLAANVVDKTTRRPLFEPYAIEDFGGVEVGFIGMTLEGTPDIVSPSGIRDLDFLDEAETANRYARELRRKGVEAIVVLLHEGGVPTGAFNECPGISGPIVDIVDATTGEVDLFVTGHTHQAYNCVIDGRPVTSAASNGRLITDLDVTLSTRSGEVTQVVANNRIVTRNVMAAPDIRKLIAHYNEFAGPIAARVVGRTSAEITRTPDDSREHAAGNLIADAQLAATDTPESGGAVAAFMNPGGVRADFPAGEITYGKAFEIQPFGNNLTTITLTGAQLWTMLQQQWCGRSSPVVLLPSDTVRYTWSESRVPGACSTNPVTSFAIAGEAVPNDGSRSYRITVNSFLADGGDTFPVLRGGTDRLGGEVDTDALEKYFVANSPVPPPALDRIHVID